MVVALNLSLGVDRFFKRKGFMVKRIKGNNLFNGDGSRSSVRFKINNDLFGERHTDPALDHKDPNPATLAPCLL
jgi:hypothetical protein